MLDRQRVKATIKAQREMNEKQANIASALQSQVALFLNDLVQNKTPIATMTRQLKDMATTLKESASVERLARGVPNEVVENQLGGTVKHEHEHHANDLVERINADPLARKHALELLAQLAQPAHAGPAEPSGVGAAA